MSKLTKFKVRRSQFPLDFRIDDTTRDTNIKRLVAMPGTVFEEGTEETAETYNGLQLGLVHSVTPVKSVANSIDYYTCDIEGIADFGMHNELKLQVKIMATNEYNYPKIKMAGNDYQIMRFDGVQLTQVLTGQLKTDNIYNLSFNGTLFILSSGMIAEKEVKALLDTTDFQATETQAGLVTLNTIREEESYLSGAKYDGVLGVNLKNIVAGNSYLYLDSNGKGIICKALNTKINSSGFLVPNSSDFIDITNNNLNTIMNVKTNVISAPWILFDVLSGATNETILNIGRPFRLASVLLKIDKFAVMDQEVSLIIPWNLEARFRTALPTLSPSMGQVIASDWNRIHVKIISEGQNLRVTAGNQTGASNALKVTVLKIDIIN